MLQKNMKATNHAVTEYGRGVRQAGSNSVGNVFFFQMLTVFEVLVWRKLVIF